MSGSLPPVGDFDGDGVSDEADACPIAAGPGNGCPAPEATPTGSDQPGASGVEAVSVLPGGCLPKGVFKIRLNPRKSHMKSASLTLDGHRVKLVKGKRRWTAKIDLSHSTRTATR